MTRPKNVVDFFTATVAHLHTICDASRTIPISDDERKAIEHARDLLRMMMDLPREEAGLIAQKYFADVIWPEIRTKEQTNQQQQLSNEGVADKSHF